MKPDEINDKTRLELLPFEDFELRNLTTYVPNYYPETGDQTLYGSILRAIAQELARLEYNINYYIVSKDTKYLTPSDTKRIYEDPAFIDKSAADNTYDNAYKQLVIDIVSSFGLGSVSRSIKGILEAYTGYQTEVTEVFKEIGTGIYDISDKNTININIMAPSTDMSNLMQLVTKELVASVILAKPAHVGVNLSTVFLEGPDVIDSFITDELIIIASLSESDGIESGFVIGPFLDSEPESTLAGADDGHGLVNPVQNTVWEIIDDELIGLDED